MKDKIELSDFEVIKVGNENHVIAHIERTEYFADYLGTGKCLVAILKGNQTLESYLKKRKITNN